MNTYAIEVKDLSKSFGRKKVLKGLSFVAPSNSIIGFLGPNGAGKTTSMRILMGLIPRFEGSINLLGYSIPKQRIAALERIGSMVENPSFIETMSAAENLKWFGSLYRHFPEKRIDEVLELTGLKEATKQRFGVFSSGMKQRLGIAFGLLHKPHLLLLDEPSSGLDPAGRVQMRKILQNIHDAEKTTIFLSSHLLDEVQRLCDYTVIINAGQTVAEGFVSDLLRNDKEKFEVRVPEGQLSKLTELLGNMKDMVFDFYALSRGVSVQIGLGQSALFNRSLLEAGLEVEALIPLEKSLEEMFMRVTEEKAV